MTNSEPASPSIREKDRPLHLKKRGLVILCAALMPLITSGLSWFSNVVERVYTDAVGQWITRVSARVSGLVLFSLAEIVLVVLVVWGIASGVRALYHTARGLRRWTNALACGGLRFLTAAGILILIFYGAWALNFARADLITRMKWLDLANNKAAQASKDELPRLCEELVAAANLEYERANATQDLGRPSAPPVAVAVLDEAINKAYGRVVEKLRLHPSFAVSRGRAKPVRLSVIMSYLLTSGFYSPWTGEANYNRQVPVCTLPDILAHEKAHQRCVTSEDEANFFGFLACVCSDEPYARYSGYIFAQRQLLAELAKSDPNRVKQLVKKRLPGVQRDVDEIRRFHETHEGMVSTAGRAVNNAYLKSNRVKGGVQSYQMSARLLVVFARANGGSLEVEPGE